MEWEAADVMTCWIRACAPETRVPHSQHMPHRFPPFPLCPIFFPS